MKVKDVDKLRDAIARSGLSYRELAARAGISHAVLANLARGARDGCSDETARRLCFAFDVAPSSLFLSDVYTTVVQDTEEKRTVHELEGEQV